MIISVGCDHGGYKLKKILCEYLTQNNYEVKDFGSFDENSVDYPPIGAKVAASVVEGKANYGLLVCSTGIGISMSANKVKGARAALCTDIHSAEMTRRHNNANVLCLGGHIVTAEIGTKILDVFLNTEFEGGRHQRRVDLIHEIEEGKY